MSTHGLGKCMLYHQHQGGRWFFHFLINAHFFVEKAHSLPTHENGLQWNSGSLRRHRGAGKQRF